VITRRHQGDVGVTEQDERGASVERFPTDTDLTIGTDRSGRWAFSFVRGVVSLGFSVSVLVVQSGERIPVDQAHSYAPGERQESTVVRNNDRIRIEFVDGICEFSVNKLRKTFNLRVDSGIAGMR
jgi:hypothetical protein